MAPSFESLLQLGLSRWLHGLDLDPSSKSVGFGDREYWSWRTKDFSNGTFQGGLLACLETADLVPLNESQLINLVERTIVGSRRVQRKDGSFEEAYPHESSYAVTGLVIANLAAAHLRHPKYFSELARETLRTVVAQGARYLAASKETHGTISNHVASTQVAIALANRLDPSLPEPRWADLIRMENSAEGWFCEYDGADPGYQTLLNHYLLLARLCGIAHPALEAAHERSVEFVSAFAFPDGSFAGEIGSRGTSIVYPSGLCAVVDGDAHPSPALAWFLEKHLRYAGAVTPTNVDGGNLVPLLNAWSLSRTAAMKCAATSLPVSTSLPRQRVFAKAGLCILESPSAKVVIALKNGAIRGIVQRDGRWIDSSLVALTSPDGAWTTQRGTATMVQSTDARLVMQLRLGRRAQPFNDAFRSIVIRVVAIVAVRLPVVQRLFKNALAAFVMRRTSSTTKPVATLTLDLAQDSFPCAVAVEPGVELVQQRYGFHHHMASANTFSPRSL